MSKHGPRRPVIAIEGIDASGKSTLGSGLVARLASEGLHAESFGLFGNQNVSDAMNAYSDGGVRSSALWALGVNLSLRLSLDRAHQSEADIAIFDRHKWSALAKERVAGLTDALTADAYHDIPDPDLTIYLVFSAEDALARIRAARRGISWWEMNEAYLGGRDYCEARERFLRGEISEDERERSFVRARSAELFQYEAMLGQRSDTIRVDAAAPPQEVLATVWSELRGRGGATSFLPVLVPGGVVDGPKRATVEVSGAQSYVVPVGGELDEFNTAQYRRLYGTFNVREEPRFQPNLQVEITNVGSQVVENPRLVVNGRRDWQTMDALLKSVLPRGASDREKAFALHSFFARSDVQTHNHRTRPGPTVPCEDRAPSITGFGERGGPIRGINTYYASGCPQTSANLAIAARAAGLPARVVGFSPPGRGVDNHTATEIFYDGEYHLFDPEVRAFFLRDDNEAVASAEDLQRDPRLIMRTHLHGPAALTFEESFWYDTMYRSEGGVSAMPIDDWDEEIAWSLRPHESIIFCWSREGKFFYGDKEPRYDLPQAPARLSNSLVRYRIDLSRPSNLVDAVLAENVRATPAGMVLADSTFGGRMIVRVDCPFPIVDASATITAEGDRSALGLLVAQRDAPWEPVKLAPGDRGLVGQIGDALSTLRGEALRRYYVRLDVPPGHDAAVQELELSTHFQTTETALPSLGAGRNVVHYRDDSGGSARVRITHAWVESSAWPAPPPPCRPLEPVDGAVVAGAPQRLAWDLAGSMAGFHVQVSLDDRFVAPASPNLDRIAAGEVPEWPMPLGWLRPGVTYFWRVRTVSSEGVWSGWGPAWCFATS